MKMVHHILAFYELKSPAFPMSWTKRLELITDALPGLQYKGNIVPAVTRVIKEKHANDRAKRQIRNISIIVTTHPKHFMAGVEKFKITMNDETNSRSK
jgi:hypothetical protein